MTFHMFRARCFLKIARDANRRAASWLRVVQIGALLAAQLNERLATRSSQLKLASRRQSPEKPRKQSPITEHSNCARWPELEGLRGSRFGVLGFGFWAWEVQQSSSGAAQQLGLRGAARGAQRAAQIERAARRVALESARVWPSRPIALRPRPAIQLFSDSAIQLFSYFDSRCQRSTTPRLERAKQTTRLGSTRLVKRSSQPLNKPTAV